MNEHRNERRPGDDAAATPRGCARAEELVTYLYGEATPAEARVFRQHLDACAVCREEFAALGGVRESLGAWRAEALGALPSLDIKEDLPSAVYVKERPLAPALPREGRARERSAAAALREFFSLSPLWLRAGAVAAALVVCALAALTLARAEVRLDSNGLAFRAGVAERTVVERVIEPARPAVEPARTGYTEEQLNAAVAERLKAARAEWEAAQTRPEVFAAVAAPDETLKRQGQRAGVKSTAPRARRTPQRSPGSDEELADLPRLSDLLDGSY